MTKHVDIRLTEQMVVRGVPGLQGWRNYRIEYGPLGRDYMEGVLWLPPQVDADEVEDWLNGLQEEKTRPPGSPWNGSRKIVRTRQCPKE